MGLSSIFGVSVTNPKSFGVIEFDKNHNITNIIEKPKFTKSNIIVSGLYFYTNDAQSMLNNWSQVIGEKKK